MPFCGFNEMMLSGVEKIINGIINQFIQNKDGGIVMFCGFNQNMLEGLKTALEAFRVQVSQADVKNNNTAVKKIIGILESQDGLYYKKLRPAFGEVEGIKKWIESFDLLPEKIDPLILYGLMLFTKGIYEQAFKRAEDDSLTLEKSYQSEIKELTLALDIIETKL